MTVFLTSSPCLLGEEKLNPANGFVEALRKALPSPCRCLFITSDRDNHAFTEGHGYAIKRSFEGIMLLGSDSIENPLSRRVKYRLSGSLGSPPMPRSK